MAGLTSPTMASCRTEELGWSGCSVCEADASGDPFQEVLTKLSRFHELQAEPWHMHSVNRTRKSQLELLLKRLGFTV